MCCSPWGCKGSDTTRQQTTTILDLAKTSSSQNYKMIHLLDLNDTFVIICYISNREPI